MLRRLGSVAAKAPRWHVAIVGSGPAGWYTADQLLKSSPDVCVDIYERLPVPFGLVRYGVAPDHQTVKNVTDRFGQIASDERCSLIGNVCIGMGGIGADSAAHLPLEALQQNYNAVLLSYGASADRMLGVPGEDLAGVCAARSFVEWYNGHPESPVDAFDLSKVETAVIVGNGNVALDCARLLCSTPDELVGSDVTEHAAAELARSAVRQVVLLGRRGALQAAFTIKELRELTKRDGATMSLEVGADAFSEAVMSFAGKDRARKRLVELMQKVSSPEPEAPPASPPDGKKAIRVQFQRSPTAFLPAADDPASLGGARIVRTALEGEPSHAQRAVPIEGSEYELPCQLAMRAIGYKSLPIEGAPFDARRGVVPNSLGRVDGAPGLYVAGWLKRGPSGVILTNVTDANETAAMILEDRAAGLLDGAADGGAAIRPLIGAQGKPLVDFEGWRRVDEEEMRRGALVKKAREKVISEAEMLQIAGA